MFVSMSGETDEVGTFKFKSKRETFPAPLDNKIKI